ncbi:uncharacterized protein PFLUO_LOCUS914 [Penicillium psychrofluorescens]|uniref:uncharacterized protein n=1 Tax=Penicillium psychrofluorescens TaxID=3158075 RepID=UPI003CCD98B1
MSSKLHQIALAYIDGFRTLSPEAFLSILSPSAKHKFAPASLKLPESMDAAAFADHLGSLREVIASFPVYPKEIWENEALGQVTIWATSETIFHEKAKGDNASADDWKFQGEYIFILTMDESQEKVEEIVEFLDSKATERLRELMAQARKNLSEKKDRLA